MYEISLHMAACFHKFSFTYYNKWQSYYVENQDLIIQYIVFFLNESL